MKDFTLPANIKQIGSIGSGLRIYMEDYVCTFLHQYAAAGGYNERIAYLVGRHMLIDSQAFLFISGAIYGMYAEEKDGFTRFTHQSAKYAEAMLDEHFPGQEIVGWMQSQPSYGTYLNQHYGAYHLRQFTKPYQVMFVMDPLERGSAFYMANPSAITPADRVQDIGGYFIYYEKNVNMHEYMLTNKTEAATPTFVEPSTFSDLAPEIHEAEDEDDEYADEYATRHMADPEEVIRRHQVKTSRRKQRPTKAEQKRTSNMLGGLCAVLFVVSFIMGVGLIRGQDRIDRMEGEIRQLVTAHRNLFVQMSSLQSAPVFAEANPTAEAAENSVHFYTHVYDGPTNPMPTAAEIAETPDTPVVYTTPAPVHQQVYSPQETYVPAVSVVPDTYTIQPGDSLLAISLYFFGSAAMVDEILALNGLADPDHIVAGRTIILPQR
jgi:hypothetical protein